MATRGTRRPARVPEQNGRRGAPPAALEDPTPLDGPRIDVARRIGWLLRTARLDHRPATSMAALGRTIGANLAGIHRIETGERRSGATATAYETALGLAPGSLRAPIDTICRGFPYAPAETDPGPPVTTVAAMSALTHAVAEGPGTGGDWWAWARAVSQPGSISLYVPQAHDLVSRLVGEMNRALGSAYTTRYEALAVLRCGPYADVVFDVVRERVADPHVQVLLDLMSALGEHPTPDAAAWCVGLLDDPRPRVVVGAALALENMAEISGRPDFWTPHLPDLLDRFDAAADGSEGWLWLSHVLRLVPRSELTRLVRPPGRPLAPLTTQPPGADPVDDWAASVAAARDVTHVLGWSDQPMLARLVHDICFSPYEARAVTGYMLLSGLPPWCRATADAVCALATRHPDPVVRERIARRVPGLVHADPPAQATAWLDSGDESLQTAALRMLSVPGGTLSDDTLRSLVDATPSRLSSAALLAAGMTGSPVLTEVANDPAATDDRRGAARWWVAEGSRITDGT